jgi:predicted DNA-binding protein (MmcQ/YjbR family)
MNIEEYRTYCLSKPATTESFPFDQDVLVFKVMDKMFTLTSLKKWENGDYSVNLKCDPDKALELRVQYPEDVFPGYHMSKKHWNTVVIQNGNLNDDFVKKLIDDSYMLIIKSLPKKKQAEFKEIKKLS